MVAIVALMVAIVFLIVYVVTLKAKAKENEIKRLEMERRLAEARKDAEQNLKEALKEAKELALKENREHDLQQREKNAELQKAEKRIQKREETIDKRSQQLEQKEKEVKKKEELLEREEKKASESLKVAEKKLLESQSKLESIAQLSLDEARELLRESILKEVEEQTASEVKSIEDEARKVAEERARGIIATGIQRITNDFVTDACVSVITLPSDDMKGRIIGREGRNIRAIEQATGVDIIIDDTPEAVIISCFNPVRREIAKIAIERLIGDGRIHPARIEEIVQRVTSEFDTIMKDAGEKSSFDCGIQGLHPEVIMALGKLKFLTAGAQSVLQHSIETSQIAGAIAAELELNVKLARRAGLLHDIGKALAEDNEGHHSNVGAAFAQKNGEAPEVVEAILKHHTNNVQQVNPITAVVQIANSLSGFRPGARKEFLEKSIERMREMETLAQNFEHVDHAFVIRSGREVRALVSSQLSEDSSVSLLARDLGRKIRSEINFPGQVKVTLIRETRHSVYAK